MILFFAAEEGDLLPRLVERGHPINNLGVLVTFAAISDKKLAKVQECIATSEKLTRRKSNGKK